MSFFNSSNPQHRQLAEAHQSGDYSPLDASQLASTYKAFVDHGPEADVQAVHQEYFDRMPKVQQMGLFSSLIGAVQQNGIDPRQAGVSTTDPHQASSFDLGNLFNLARNSGLLGGMFGSGQSQSGLGSLVGGLTGNSGGYSGQAQMPSNENNSGGFGSFGNIINNPIAQAAIGGLISFAANKALGGNQSQAGTQPTQSSQTQPSDQSLPGIQSLPQTQPDQNGFQNNNPPTTPQSSW